MTIELKRIKGRLANVILAYAHYYSYCLDNNIELIWNIPPVYSEYFKYFDKGWLKNRTEYFYKKMNLACKVFLNKLKLNSERIKFLNIGYDNPPLDEEFSQYANEKTLILDTGIYSVFDMKHNVDKVIKRFELSDKYQKIIDNYIKKFRTDVDILVGVHVRHGDYVRWQGGKFFVEADVYGRNMENFSKCFPDRKIRFLICTDDPKLTEKDFCTDGLDIKFCGLSEIVDLTMLSKCDYLFGPKSTYAFLASILGDVPRFEILNDSEDFTSLEQFKKVF